MKRPKSKKKIQTELLTAIQNEINKSEIIEVNIEYNQVPFRFEYHTEHIEMGLRVLTIRYMPKVRK